VRGTTKSGAQDGLVKTSRKLKKKNSINVEDLDPKNVNIFSAILLYFVINVIVIDEGTTC